jgi:membrane protease YdiL (CAAX protease family)
LFAPLSLPQLALICALAGLGEELFFRALLQGGLAQLIDPQAALLIASAVFGLLHMITPTYALLATLLGIYLGGCWMLADNLLVPIVAHGFYDFVALVYLLRINPPPPPAEPEPLPPPLEAGLPSESPPPLSSSEVSADQEDLTSSPPGPGSS